MTISKTENFLSHFAKFPNGIKKIYAKQEAIFEANWLDPRLHAKKIKELKGVFSFRITWRYRVLFYFRDRGAVFFSVGHRKDIYD